MSGPLDGNSLRALVRWVAPVLTIALLAGCGGGEKPVKPALYTRAQVAEHYERETGEALKWEPVLAKQVETLSSGDSRYGQFLIYVAKTEKGAALAASNRPSFPGDKLYPRDAHGIVWFRTCPPKEVKLSCFYMANRRFGRNVVLNWISRDGRTVTPGFERVSEVLGGLP